MPRRLGKRRSLSLDSLHNTAFTSTLSPLSSAEAGVQTCIVAITITYGNLLCYVIVIVIVIVIVTVTVSNFFTLSHALIRCCIMLLCYYHSFVVLPGGGGSSRGRVGGGSLGWRALRPWLHLPRCPGSEYLSPPAAHGPCTQLILDQLHIECKSVIECFH